MPKTFCPRCNQPWNKKGYCPPCQATYMREWRLNQVYRQRENDAEIARHHRDFAEISTVVQMGLDGQMSLTAALKRIQGIVG